MPDMILCLDAGNSRLKCGLFDGEAWRMQGALNYDAFDDLVAELPEPPTRVVAAFDQQSTGAGDPSFVRRGSQ